MFLAACAPCADEYVHGKVACGGKGIADVVVTDGFDCVKTDEDGLFRLEKKRDARFVYITTPAGYLVNVKDKTIPQFYKRIEKGQDEYNFELIKNKRSDERHLFLVQADVQVTGEPDLRQYQVSLKDMRQYIDENTDGRDIFGIDCGDMVDNNASLYPLYLKEVGMLDIPIYRAIGNHDMTYGGRTYEYSYQTYEDYFGPIYYSFNKGKIHYIVLNNNFYVNRDFQYIGYIDERTFVWLEKDLSYVSSDTPVILIAHIPISLTKELQWNKLLQDETSNAAGLFDILRGYKAHIISGHWHTNTNICYNDSLMEHNVAAVCGSWWKKSVCMDGTPAGYGVFEVDGTDVRWVYKSVGYPVEYQFKVYPQGVCKEYPSDFIANVWNWDDEWKVEWYENGKYVGAMERYTGKAPDAGNTEHLFHATPMNPQAEIMVRVTDRFGNVYEQKLLD